MMTMVDDQLRAQMQDTPTDSSKKAEEIWKQMQTKMETALSSPTMKSFLAGALSGSISTLLLQPLDLVKTRLQSPVYIGSNHGMITVALTVVREEQFLGLWKGVWPSLARCAPGVGLYFSTLHFLRTNFGSNKPKAYESLFMGMGARSIAAIIVLPITVIKTRYESGTFHYKGIAKALASTYKVDGVRGLFSGLSPTLLRDVPFSGIYLMFYTQLKQHKSPSSFRAGMEPMVDFCYGVVGGAMASFVTQPADVIKTSMQLCPQKYNTFKHVLIYIYQERGISGFWRGIVPRMLRRTLMTALAWTVFEEIMRRCKLK